MINNPIAYDVLTIHGTNITFPTTTSIALATAHVYLVAFVISADIAANAEMTVTPRINGVLHPEFSATSNTANIGEATVSSTFLLDTIRYGATIILEFVYSGTTNGLTPDGSFSIVEVQ